MRITVHQGINEPPQLVAEVAGKSRILWDPNPELKSIELGSARPYTWKDNAGRRLVGGLYVPIAAHGTGPHPLVIQTHGFEREQFAPSGWYPGPYAARALQAAGIMVLQIDEDCVIGSPGEASCATSAYEGAIRQLLLDGLVDTRRIGIIGFSRTCFYVMEALTKNTIPIAAASVTDGNMLIYLQYILSEGAFDDGTAADADAVIGVRPFGEGLEQWVRRSAGFNLDKINAPLRVVSEGPESLLWMWEPYAGLRYLRKPVDLILLNTNEHIPSSPAVRMAAQSGTVDWFRFWLKDEEDGRPDKIEQYQRWRRLREQRNAPIAGQAQAESRADASVEAAIQSQLRSDKEARAGEQVR